MVQKEGELSVSTELQTNLESQLVSYLQELGFDQTEINEVLKRLDKMDAQELAEYYFKNVIDAATFAGEMESARETLVSLWYVVIASVVAILLSLFGEIAVSKYPDPMYIVPAAIALFTVGYMAKTALSIGKDTISRRLSRHKQNTVRKILQGTKN